MSESDVGNLRSVREVAARRWSGERNRAVSFDHRTGSDRYPTVRTSALVELIYTSTECTRCPGRVIRVISSVRQPLPVCPQLRTLATRREPLCGPDERAKRKQPAGADGLDHRRRWSLCPPRRKENSAAGAAPLLVPPPAQWAGRPL
jgi:hypothetical protein